jgi:HSP20 family protein
MAIIRLRQPAYPGAGFVGGRFGKNFNVFENEMNRLFQRFFGENLTNAHPSVYPLVNIYQDNDNIYLTAELPGMESNEVSIDIEHDGIQIAGERKIDSEGENICYHRREREGGKFSRRLTFRSKIDIDNVSAQLKDGILKVTMPKARETKPKKISVKAE